jgi:hypothetical protein
MNRPKNSRYKDWTGKKIHSLLFIKPIDKKRGNGKMWQALCDCGNYCMVVPYRVVKGLTRHCGCQQRKRTSCTCSFCNTKFERINSELKKNKGRGTFCSPECWYKFQTAALPSIEQLTNEYLSGTTIVKLAERYNVSQGTVQRRLTEANVVLRPLN